MLPNCSEITRQQTTQQLWFNISAEWSVSNNHTRQSEFQDASSIIANDFVFSFYSRELYLSKFTYLNCIRMYMNIVLEIIIANPFNNYLSIVNSLKKGR